MSTDAPEPSDVLIALIQVDPHGLPPLNAGRLQEHQDAYAAAVDGIAEHVRANCTRLVRLTETRSGVGEFFVEGTAANIEALLNDPILVQNKGRVPDSIWSSNRNAE